MGVKRYTDSERQFYLEAFKSSGLSQAAFSKEHSIHFTTLNGWLRRGAKKRGSFSKQSSSVVLSEVQIGNPRSEQTLAVELPNQIKLHVPCGDFSHFLDLVRGLLQC